MFSASAIAAFSACRAPCPCCKILLLFCFVKCILCPCCNSASASAACRSAVSTVTASAFALTKDANIFA